MLQTLKRFFALACAALLLLAVPGAQAREAEPLNVLLIGVDQSAPGTRGRSDTMMLARVNPSTGSIRLVSFLRDLYVPIPGLGKTRLNAAYQQGGEPLLKEALVQNFHVSVDHTVTVSFSMLSDLVDQVGGVELDIEEKERKALNAMIREYNADYGLSGGEITQSGTQVLDGRQALCYSRLRKIDSDFQRTSRQQRVLEGLMHRLSEMSKWQLLRLAVQNLSRVETDLTFGDLAALAPLLAGDGLSLECTRVPFDGDYREDTIRGMMVLVPDLSACQRKLRRFLEDD